MTIQYISSKDEAKWLDKRKSYITSTESASLFGLQMPSLPTAFELWHIKRGNIDGEVEVNNYMQWGRVLEDAIKAIVEIDNPDWHIRPMEAFAYDDNTRMGASFDNVIEHPERGIGLLEIKTTSYRDYKMKFIEDDETDFIECPAYYEVQGQHQLEMMQGKYDYVCFAVAILDTREVKYIFRERDADMGERIKNKIEWFWKLGDPPPADMEKDCDLLTKMQRANSNDTSADLTDDTDFMIAADSYIAAQSQLKEYEGQKKRAKSQMILCLKDHQRGYSNDYRISNKSRFSLTQTKKD